MLSQMILFRSAMEKTDRSHRNARQDRTTHYSTRRSWSSWIRFWGHTY